MESLSQMEVCDCLGDFKGSPEKEEALVVNDASTSCDAQPQSTKEQDLPIIPTEDNDSKKNEIHFMSIIECQKRLQVKLDRSPQIDKLAMEYQHSKSVEKMWPGYKGPSPKVKETIRFLQCLINDMEQLWRGVLASRRFQIESEQTTSPPSEEVPWQTNSLSVDVEPNLEKDNTDNKYHSEEPMEEDGGLCGFDLDTMSGNCRGFPTPSTKSRDELKQMIKRLERNMKLVSMLEEIDKDVRSFHKAEQNNCETINNVTSRKRKGENNVQIGINQHLKDLLRHVTCNISKEPPFSYMVLIIMALQTSQEPSMSLTNILQYIKEQFPYYLTASTSWVNSVSQTIHWSDIFVKTCSASCHVKTSTDHGGCWTVDPETAEAILERAVDALNRRAKGILRFDKTTSVSPLSTNKKNDQLKNKICKPFEVQQSIKPGSNVFEDITEKLNVSKIKRRKTKVRDMKNEDVFNKIHLILKTAKNIETQKKDTFSEVERKCHKVKENVEKNKDVDVKINQHLKDLMGFVASNPLMEPPFSYMVLAVMALKSSPQPSLPLNDIFQFIRDNFPFYRSGNESWMNAVMRTINWSNTFVKTCFSSCPAKKSPEHGGCWSVDPVTAEEILARAAEVYHKKGKENNLELVGNEQNIMNEVNNPEKGEDREVSINIEERCRDKILHCITNEELSSQTHDIKSEYENCEEPGILSSNGLDNDSVATKSIKDVFLCEGHSLNTGFSYDVNETDEQISSNDYLSFYCHGCKNAFECVFYLKHHQCSEGGSKTEYPCYLCHTKFTDVDKFCSHLATDHEGMVNKHDPSPLCWIIKDCKLKNHLKCQICSAIFTNLEMLGGHIQLAHS